MIPCLALIFLGMNSTNLFYPTITPLRSRSSEMIKPELRLKNVVVLSDSQDCFLMEERLVFDMDGIDGNMTIFGEWPAFNPSSRTFISEFFNKDFVPRPILDFVEDDNQSSFITMEFEKKIPPISFEEEKKIGLDCNSDVSSELLGSNVQKSCLRRVQNERMAAMARFNMLKANMSQSDQEKIMLKINSGQSETKNYISSLPEDFSSWMLLSSGVSPTSLVESVDCFSNSMDASTIDQEQALPTSNASLQENLKLLPSSRRKENNQDIVADKKASDSLVVDESPLPPSDGHQNGETGPESEFSCFPGSDPAKDGYNWRKYGQKQLKGSDFPCSYHKCTHPNCPVKKKIERSIQGHVTEIIYRGFHNHPKPPPNYRSTIPSSKQFNGPPTEHLEGASPTSFTKLCGPSKFFKSSRLELVAIDALCPVSTDKDGNGATPGSSSVECDVDEEEMESKRRKQELVPSGNSAASRAMHEARIVVQIRSEDDIPDDGYRWRKYGQKIVKGNPNPRSYYKCSQLGCAVRKHVERASDDLKSVISTYEGKHNHDVPSARNINRPIHCPSSSPSATAALQLSSFYPSPDLAKNSFIKLEEGRAPMSAFGLLAPATSFSFDFNQSKWVSLRPSGSGSMGPFKVPFFSPMDQEMDRHRQDGGGNVMPGRKVKEEPM